MNFRVSAPDLVRAAKHPILNKIRAHKGVDYAAPKRTPIKSTGDGKIIHIGNKGGYGKTIIVQHGNKYNTPVCTYVQIQERTAQRQPYQTRDKRSAILVVQDWQQDHTYIMNFALKRCSPQPVKS